MVQLPDPAPQNLNPDQLRPLEHRGMTRVDVGPHNLSSFAFEDPSHGSEAGRKAPLANTAAVLWVAKSVSCVLLLLPVWKGLLVVTGLVHFLQ